VNGKFNRHGCGIEIFEWKKRLEMIGFDWKYVGNDCNCVEKCWKIFNWKSEII